MSATRPILVIGSTGKTGRRVAARLEALGHAVRHGHRRAAIPFDWERSETWAPSLKGVRAAYVAFYPDLAVPGADDAITELTAIAVSAGVERLVLLSGRGEPGAQVCERIVLDAPIEATVLRAGWFAQNFDEGVLSDGVSSGVIALPAGDAREPFIDVDDLAEVAVHCLLDDGHDGEVYEMTGPRLLSFDEVAADLSAATGRSIRYENITLDAHRTALEASQPPAIASFLTDLLRDVLDGRNEWLGDGVQRVLGREPRDFRAWAAETARAGGWMEVAR